MLYGVILAGGRGERFWPLSRVERPKQFLRLLSDKIMLEETVERVLPLIPMENILIVTGSPMSKLVRECLPDISDKNILGEPCGRNTCAAIGLAATHLIKTDPDAVMAVLSADHLIRPAEKLLKILEDGAAIAARNDYLMTIGIVPTRAETGYGYIKVGKRHDYAGEHQVYHVSAFTEKPRPEVAKEYYLSGNYLWNSGMFIWSAKSILKAVDKWRPELSELLKEYSVHIGTPAESEAHEKLYRGVTSISIDFAVLEKASNVLTIKADIVWDDVGDWNALERYMDRDPENNVLVGKTAVLDSYETTIYNDSDGIITCMGVSDLIIVRSGDITMVIHKTRAQSIKKVLELLAENEETRKYL